MADEQADRLYKRKRIKDPQNPATYYVDVPVIYKATFKTMAEQAQERIFYLRNGGDADRQVRVQRVQNPSHHDLYVNVERIKRLPTKTVQEQAQEHYWYLVNDDPPPAQADNDDPSHEQKHFVRYVGNNPQAWVDVELIDKLKITVAAEQYQEYFLYLRWPNPNEQPQINDPDDPFQPLTLATCDPSLEALDPEEGIDPPYRMDPFQNIINVHWPTTGIARTWYSCVPAGNGLIVDIRDALTTGTGFALSGQPCRIHDTPGIGLARPGYNICDWPISTPLTPPTEGFPQTEPFDVVGYSAGTLYKKLSDVILAYDHSRFLDGTQIYWHSRNYPCTEPDPPGTVLLCGGPETSPATGALCPELNGAANNWAIYFATKIGAPKYVPHWRIFVVDDDDYETNMDGIHDPQDRPDIDEWPDPTS